MTKVKSTPALRFPGFEGERWSRKRLGDISDLITKGTTPSKFSESGINYVKIECLDGTSIVKDRCLYVDDSTHNKELKRSILKENDILFAIAGATVGKIGIVTKEILPANTNQALAIIRLSDKSLNPFLLNVLDSRKMKNYIFQSISVGAQPNLNLQQINNFEFNLPENSIEQQKIASFLSAVDNRIQLLKQKKEKLQAYKNGVLQQIFSQQIRFKDDKENYFPDWEEKRLGELYDFKSTNSFSREKLNYSAGEVKNIHYGDIHTKFRTHFDITQELVPFINTDVYLSRIKEECYVQEGDLIIADASEDTADIGKTIEAVNLNGEKVLAGLHTFLARRKDKALAVGFAGHLVKSNDIRLQVMKIAQGTKVLSISTGRLANVTAKIPVVAEQQKITSFLTSLDKAIEAVQAQTDRSAEFKKGLLQQLFV